MKDLMFNVVTQYGPDGVALDNYAIIKPLTPAGEEWLKTQQFEITGVTVAFPVFNELQKKAEKEDHTS